MTHLTILWSLCKNNLKREAEFRINFFLMFILELGSLIALFLILDIQFMYANRIAGWSQEEVILLTGVYKIVEGIIDFSFFKNLKSIPEYVRRGDLDLFLSKPISVQFLASFRYLSMFRLIGVVSGGVIVGYAIVTFSLPVSLWNGVLLVLMLGAGLTILYSIFLIVVSICFWTSSLHSINDVYKTLTAPLTVPIDIFGKQGAWFLNYIIPLGFVISMPTAVFLNRVSWTMIGMAIATAIILFVLSRAIWNRGLKRYSGASS